MRLIFLVLVGSLLVSGCATKKSETVITVGAAKGQAVAKPAVAGQQSLSVTNGTTVVTLTDSLAGKVASVNSTQRFAVLDFSLSRLPSVDQQLGVYRKGLKVGEVKVSGPAYYSNIVADIVAGEVQPGDEVRQN